MLNAAAAVTAREVNLVVVRMNIMGMTLTTVTVTVTAKSVKFVI
jgi:hypothetical protein